MLFRLLLGLDVLAALVVLYFFAAGLADGSVSSFNMGLWLGLLLAVAAIVGGGVALRRAGRQHLASAMLALLAVPAALYALFLALVIFSGARWN